MRWIVIFLQFFWHNCCHVKIRFLHIILNFQIYLQILLQFFLSKYEKKE